MHRAFYSILKYCPDPVRGESVNVGVLVVGAQTHRFRLVEHVGSIRRFMPGFDDTVLENHRHAVDAFFRTRPYRILSPDGRVTDINRLTRDVVQEFTRRFCGPLLWYTAPARVEGNIDSPFSLETLRDDLYEQFLVRRDPTRAQEKQRKERVKTILRNEFETCDFFNRAKYLHPMEADRDIDLRRHGFALPASFCIDNGVLHVFEPIDALEEEETLAQLRDISLAALVFHELIEELGERVKTYACLVRPPGADQVRELRILREYSRVVDLSDRAEREKFFLEIHDLQGPRGAELFHL